MACLLVASKNRQLAARDAAESSKGGDSSSKPDGRIGSDDSQSFTKNGQSKKKNGKRQFEVRPSGGDGSLGIGGLKSKDERRNEHALKELSLARAMPRQSKRGSRTALVCVLCGEPVAQGTLLQHKEQRHGETRVTSSPVHPTKASQWVSIVQGGLPGLGKRH